MGFYLRKSVSVGPFRFNLSTSGLGVSAGVRGFRVGTGPRGNYVHMGRGGLYYRAALGARGPNARRAPLLPSPQHSHESHDELQEIDSSDVSSMVDSSAEELLQELAEKRRRGPRWPLVAFLLPPVLFLISLALSELGLGLSLPAWLFPALLGVCVLWAIALYQRDVVRRTVVVLYDLEEDAESLYGLLHDWAHHLASSHGVWHIAAQGAVRDRRYHAGASHLVRRQPTRVAVAPPPFLKTNVDTVAIGAGQQTLYFFPDRLLVYEPRGVGAVSYSDLQMEITEERFIEEGVAPRDARVVDRTWRFVNKSGAPDRRFANNRQLPVCLYEKIHFRSRSGLNEVIQLSLPGAAAGFVAAAQALGAATNAES